MNKLDRTLLTPLKIYTKYILPYIQFEPNSGCWLWTGRTSVGYGLSKLPLDGGWKGVLVHRFTFGVLKHIIPAGLDLDHLCRTRCCINPDHLEPVTRLVNIRRGNTGRHNADKVVCKYGHRYTPTNTFVTRSGARRCRICKREAWKKWNARNKDISVLAKREAAA